MTRLVEAALLANHDLRAALARYDAANALARETGFDRFPTVTATATSSDSRVSADQLSGAARESRDSDSYLGSIVAAWELDLFGRVRRDVEAARADTRASALDLAALQVIIAGEVARSYLELRGLQERLRVARENADNQRETLQLVEVRLSAGRGTDFDTSRARAQLESTLARVPALEAAVAVTQHRLAVLTGNAPGALISDSTRRHRCRRFRTGSIPARLASCCVGVRTSSRPRSDCMPPLHGSASRPRTSFRASRSRA